MKILLGTTSEQKLGIIKNILEKETKNLSIVPVEVSSGITDQPLDELTTIQGSINRAKNATKEEKIYDISVGMEAGLTLVNNIYHLVCIVSIIDRDQNIYTGISEKTPLPKEVSDRIKNNEEFGIVIRDFEKKYQNLNTKISELISELISRNKSFSEALQKSFIQYGNKDLF